MKTFINHLFIKLGGGVVLNRCICAILFTCRVHALPCLLVVFILSSFHNESFAQNPFTPHCNQIDTFTNVQGPFYFKLFMYSIADDQGLGGFSQQDMEKAYRYITDAFDPHNIHFIWDCNVIDINNSAIYNTDPVGCDAAAFSSAIAEDGFHVFVFPDAPDPENLTFGGRTQYGGLKSCAGGTWIYDGPASSVGLSFILAHEIGHNLHLYHTHGDENIPLANIDGSNCKTTGDCICDTPPEPYGCGLLQHISMPGCNVINTVEGSECDYTGYMPDVHNIMSYSHPDCLRYFTKEQGQRMRNIIQRGIVENWPLADAIIPDNQQHIDQNTVWNSSSHPSGEVEIDGILYIDAGKTLTIASEITVYMGHMAQIIVKPGGRFNLHGTITSGSCSGIWKGIIVQGISSNSQEPENNEIHQGRFFSYAGSKIENANTALQLWGPTLDSVGGIAFANGTEFLNNRVTVELKPFSNYNPAVSPGKQQLPYRTNFTNCQFLVDNNYPHFENFKKFVSLYGVHGVTFRGCTFENQMSIADPLDFDAYGYGIKADFSTFTVTQLCNETYFPCPDWNQTTFKNLGYGIYASGIMRNPYRSVEIEHSIFENNYVGIFLSGTQASRILHNEFEMTTLANYELYDYMIGVAIQGPTSFIMEENEMNADQLPEVTTIGTAIIHTGPFSNVIRKNTLDGLGYNHYSTLMNANNADSYSQGLRYLCNRNSNSDVYDHYVHEWGVIRQLQGWVDNQGQVLATGNHLSKTGSSSERDFANYGPGEIDYHYYDQEANQIPEDYLNIFPIESDENSCPQRFFGPPTDQPIAQIKGKYDEERPDFEYSVSQYWHYAYSNPSEAAYYQRKATYHRHQMDTLAMAGLLYSLHDTAAYDLDSAYAWKMRYHNPHAYMQLAIWQFFAGEIQDAYRILDELDQNIDLSSAMEDERDDLIALLEEIEGHTPGHFPVRVIDELERIAYNQPGIAMFMARDLLSLQSYHFPPIIYFQSQRPEPISNGAEEDETIQEILSMEKKIIVYPNPSNKELHFDWKSEIWREGKLQISLYNSLGVLIAYDEIDVENGKYSLKVNSYPSGLYFYRLGDSQGQLFNGSVQILH